MSHKNCQERMHLKNEKHLSGKHLKYKNIYNF